MPKKTEEKVVLRRGIGEHGWHTEGYRPPARYEPFRWRSVQPVADTVPVPEAAIRAYRWGKLALSGVIVLAVVITLLLVSMRWFKADGVSMEPTLQDGDYMFVNKLAYAQVDFGLLDWAPLIDPGWRWMSPERGDIIVFRSPADGQELVKRIVGMPGDHVEIRDGAVYINGFRYLDPDAQGQTFCGDQCTWEIPSGEYFVLGDNRENSRDSREGWTVPISAIDGKRLFSF